MIHFLFTGGTVSMRHDAAAVVEHLVGRARPPAPIDPLRSGPVGCPA